MSDKVIKELEYFNKSTEDTLEYYRMIKSEEYQKEIQNAIERWRAAMREPGTWFPKPVTLEVVKIKDRRWKGAFKTLRVADWKFLYREGGLKRVFGHIWFVIKLRLNQNLYNNKKIIIQGFDTNDKPQKLEIRIRSYRYE